MRLPSWSLSLLTGCLVFSMLSLTSVTDLFRSLALAPGARHLGALGDLPFDHQPIPRHAPKMDPAIIQGPDLVPGPNPGKTCFGSV